MLFDLGPYPGLIEGDDIVLGEVWEFSAEDLPATLDVLDEIEGYRGRDGDEYQRIIVECTLGEKSVIAWAYHYARAAALTAARRIAPNQEGIYQWPAS
jgi:gamma-glutamylcyclotransferase (GGCT)/AIG2-like uncharacterized protein YtfP